MGLRQSRLADEIKDLLAYCFLDGQLRDPRLAGVTLTHVKLSGDLQNAVIYFRLYDPSLQLEAAEGLERCRGFLRTVLARKLTMRRVPVLKFVYDKSIERGAHIESLLYKARSS
jgi:ribosome-binding factor A